MLESNAQRPSDLAPRGGCGLEGHPAQAPVVATGLCENVLELLACSCVEVAALF